MYLNELGLKYKKIEYGEIGLYGQIGYDNLLVSVNDVHYDRSISPHPPSILIYKLNGKYNHFTCQVALNDTSSEFASADFYVYADNVLVSCSFNVIKNKKPRKISCNVHYCKELRLEIRTNNPLFTHAIWIDPIVEISSNMIVGSMGEIYLDNPNITESYDICIASCVTAEYLENAKIFLKSLTLNSNLKSYKIILYCLKKNQEIENLAEEYDCILLECDYKNKGFFFKTILYSTAKIIDAKKYLLIDIDTAIQKEINSVFDSMNFLSKKQILICKENFIHGNISIGKLLTTSDYPPYFGNENDKALLKLSDYEFNHNFICNGGVIFAQKEGLLALDDMIRSLMPNAKNWIDMNQVAWREQGVLNLALCRLDNIIDLDLRFNYQLLHQPLESGADANILHFNGENGKKLFLKYKVTQNLESKNTKLDPLFNSYNNLMSFGFDIRKKANLDFINFEIPYEYKSVVVVNDKYGIYSSKFILDNKEVLKFVWPNENKNFQLYNFLSELENFKEISNPDKSCYDIKDIDLLIIECNESEQRTLSQFLIFKDILSQHGKIFIVDSPLHNNNYIKERIKDKEFEIKEYESFFEIFRGTIEC